MAGGVLAPILAKSSAIRFLTTNFTSSSSCHATCFSFSRKKSHDGYNDDDEEPGDRSGGNHDSDNEVVDGGDEEEYNISRCRGGNENE